MNRAIAWRQATIAVVLSCVAPALVGASQPPPPERRPLSHAHNDYQNEWPLEEALRYGFDSIEVDLFTSGGEFLVGHRAADLRPERSLAAMYLRPLRRMADAHELDRDIVLILDVKSGLPGRLRELEALLQSYGGLVSHGEGGDSIPHVSILVSGAGLAGPVSRLKSRTLAVEGRLRDLDPAVDVAVMPQVAADWKKLFSWRGRSPMPSAERERLTKIVARVHAEGRRVRFWNTPENSTVWRALIECGADVIGTDDPPKLRGFLGPQ